MTPEPARRWCAAAAALLCLAACLASPAAPAADAAIIAAARKEGAVLWYTGLVVNQAVRPLVDAFQKRYPGIEVTVVRHGGPEIVLKTTSEARAGQRTVDMVDGGGQMIPPLVKAGILDRYRPASAAGYPPEKVSKDGYWTALTDNFLTAAINTEMVDPAEAPKTFQDLLDPKWRGGIAWTSDATLAGPPGFIGNILLTMGEEAGMDYLKKLSGQNIVNITGNQRHVLDQVIAGNYPLALMTLNHHAVISGAAGAPVQWLKMEPLVENFNIVAVVKDAPHPNAARLLIDYLASEEGQRVFREANYLPAHPNVEAKTPSLKPAGGGFKATVITPEMTEQYLPGWTQIYTELFK